MLKTDAIIGGVHFFAEDDARDVARKALRVNLSDLAAKGATPLGFLVSLALPKDIGADWLKRFARGLRDDAEAYACPLFGGDTDRTPGPVTVSISMFGSVPTGTMVRRAGAKAGDRVFVTGTIGDAALGLVLRTGRDLEPRPRRSATICWRAICCRSRATRWPKPCAPMPRRRWTCPTASPAISPSFAASPASLPASMRPRVPLSEAARAALRLDPALRETALTGGDDFEVLCTVPPAKADAFRAAAQAAQVAVADIGVVEAGEGAHFIDAAGRALTFERLSFSHF